MESSLNQSRLAARQKRYQQWKEFLETPGIAPHLKSSLTQLLSVYGNVLVDLWKSGSEQAETKLQSLERELETLNESIRLTSAYTLGREHNK
jgi:hypothetical protein